MTSRRSLVAGSVGSIIAAAAIGLPFSVSGQMYPGTRVAGIDVSGMSRKTAREILEARFASLERHAATFSYRDRTWDASLSDLGMAIDFDTMLQQACDHGRDGNLLEQYATLLAKTTDVNVPLLLKRDDTQLRSYLRGIGEEIDVDARDAHLQLRDGEITVVDHRVGSRLDVSSAMVEVNRSVQDGELATVALATDDVAPAVTSSSLDAARQDAARLISSPVYLNFGGATYPIEVDTLVAAVTIDAANNAVLDAEMLQSRVDEIANAVQIPARNVQLGWNDGLYVVEDDVDGVAVDVDAVKGTVARLAQSDDRTAELPVTQIRAAARADNIDELGLDGHIGFGSSSFVGSTEARAANVVVSCENISYKLVAPGETFSFNDLLGPITLDNGFVQGTIIQGDWAATDIGGGVCQVSTTVFRAAAYNGFQFAEWHPHGWRLDVYEADGSPPGLDGAIYQPNTPDEIEKDLVFVNPLDSWLLLMMVIDGDTAYAHFYGRDNGWKVDIFEPRISAPKPIPESIQRVNPKLVPGERRKVQNARAGCTVRIRRKVTAADGAVISDGDFVSDYRSVPEAWEVGPS